MEFAEVLRRRRMVRNYTDEPVSREAVDRIVSRACTAPSAGFSQGARMVVVTEAETRLQIAEFADEPYYVERGHEPWISRAPVHIVVAMREDDYHDRYTEPDKLEGGEEIEWPVPWWWVDAGKTTMLILLAAVDEGLGAGLHHVPEDEQRPAPRTSRNAHTDVDVVGVVAIGHPAPNPTEERRKTDLRRRRRSFEDVVHRERW